MASSGASTGTRGHVRLNSANEDECRCGRKLRLHTSWTNDNPGRRFWTCGERVNTCGYFEWYDLEMCDRAKYLISDFKSKTNRLEAELQNCRAELSHMHEEFGVAPKMKPITPNVGIPQCSVVMLALVFVCVFVAVLTANHFTR